MRKTETTNGVVREYAYTYDPQAGRFISADPRQLEPAPLQAMRMAEWDYQSGSASAGSMSEERLADWRGRTFEPQDLNRFSYVLNNPLNRVDVDGYGFWRKFFKVVLAVVVIAATSALAGLVFAAIGGTNLGVAAGVGGFTGGSLGLARSAHRNVDDLEGMLVGSMIGTGIGILTGILTYLGGAYIRENLTEVSEFLGDSARNAGKEALEGLQTQPGGQAAAGGEVAYSLARKIFRPALNFIFQDGPWAEGIRSAVFTGGTVTGGYFAAKRIDQLVDYLKNRRNCISVDIHGNSMSHACPI